VREIELRHLRVLCAVADAGSLSRAAAQLGVSQPALTAQLQRIERRIGGELFRRGNDGVRLTELGTYVVRAGRLVLAEADRFALGVAERVRAQARMNVVRVGGPPGPRVPLWAAQIATARGGSEVPIEVSIDTEDLVRQVTAGELDFLMLEGAPGHTPALPPQLRSQLLLVEPEFVGLPAGHPLAVREHIALAELADEDWVALPLNASAEQLAFTRACAAAGFTPRIRHEVTDGLTARTLVARGAVCLASAVATEGPGVVIRGLTGTPLTQEIALVWHADGRHAQWAHEALRCAALGYTSLIEGSPTFRSWWQVHPEEHAEFDALLTDLPLPRRPALVS
jgi:DNA-binding transcriptional LysR family regulator